MITERDEKMLEWLLQFKLATTKQINALHYKNITICNKRLLSLTKDKIVRRVRDPYSNQYLYSIKPIKTLSQLKHYYIRNDFYIKLFDIGCQDIFCRSVEKAMGSIIPDMCVSFNYRNKSYIYFVEVERSDNKINVEKYNRFFVQEYEEFITDPVPVIYVTHKKIPRCNFKTISVNLKLTDIENILI